MERERGLAINTLIVSTDGIRKSRPYGVTNVILESKKHLQDRKILSDRPMKIKLVGPRIPEKEDNAADVTLGRRVRVSINNTHFEVSILYASMLGLGKVKAKNFLVKEKPDLVIVHQPLAGNVTHSLMTADQKQKICFVGYFHAQRENLDIPSQLLDFFSVFLRRPSVKNGLTPGFKNTINNRLDGRAAVSQAVANFWNQYLPGDYEVIYNGIDTGRFTPEGPIMQEWKKDDKKIIFAAARFDERKRIDDLLRASSILVFDYNIKDLRIKIAGDGKMKDSLLRLTTQLGLDRYVEFLGFLSEEELIRGYRTADVFASTVEGGEGFGLTLGEAMACGTLVVGSNVAGYNEVIGGNLPFAWMTNPRDTKDIADKLKIALYLSAEERANRGKMAADYVKKKFSLSSNIDNQASYYERCLIARSKK